MGAQETFSTPRRPEGVKGRRFVDRGRRIVGSGVALGLLATLAVSVVPSLRFAYLSEETHVSIETAAFLIPGLAAVLFGGRALRGHSRTDVVLCAALALLSLTNLCFSTIPALVEEDPGRFSTWAPAAGRFLGALTFAGAALLAPRRLAAPRATLVQALAAVAVTVALVALFGAIFADDMPRGVDPALSPDSATRPRIVGHALVLGLQATTLLLYSAAAIGFLIRSERERDALLLWVALSAALSALARLNYFLFPSLYSEWVYVGDFFRIAAYLALLVGISREMLAYQRGAADAAVFEERRRLARELHDGLAQELAFLRSEGARLSGTTDPGVMRIATAAERALGEARMAISALTTPVREPLEITLCRAAEAVALRMDARVQVDCSGTPELPTAARQSLERIVREATSNAVRHGQARLVHIQIHANEQLRVSITDNGRGFKLDADHGRESFGLVSMRERAEGMNGALNIRSEPGMGTTVEVVMPNGEPEPPSTRRAGRSGR
jgi:signal transduction histidine kinase